MGKLESITTLATIAVGGLVFLKVYPLVEGFLKGSGDFIGGGGTGVLDFVDSLIPRFGEQPLRTFEPVPEVRPVLTEATETVEGIPILISPQRIAYQEAIGVPITTPEAIIAAQQPAPVLPVVQDFFTGTISMPELMQQLARPPQAGVEFWVNPLTQEQIAPYVSGQTPQGVLDLRAQDILPAIRRF